MKACLLLFCLVGTHALNMVPALRPASSQRINACRRAAPLLRAPRRKYTNCGRGLNTARARRLPMMCEEPAAAEPAPVVEAATPEPPPMTPDLPKEEGIDFSRCARRRRGAGGSAARVWSLAASRTSRRRGRRSRC